MRPPTSKRILIPDSSATRPARVHRGHFGHTAHARGLWGDPFCRCAMRARCLCLWDKGARKGSFFTPAKPPFQMGDDGTPARCPALDGVQAPAARVLGWAESTQSAADGSAGRTVADRRAAVRIRLHAEISEPAMVSNSCAWFLIFGG